MTAAGVQTNDSAAYLPPSTSTPDAKGPSAAGKQATDTQAADGGAPSDFQSELKMQQSGGQQTVPKADPGKSGKKRNVRPEDTNLSAVTPVQTTEPQKQILPLALALAAPQEDAKLDEKSTQDQIARGSAQVLSLSLAAVPLSQEVPVRQDGKNSDDPASQDQAVTIAKRGASLEKQPVSPADLKLPATPAEPIASALQEALDRAPSSPSALAFAARISAAQQKTDQAVAASQVQSPAVLGSQTSAEIPMRYAATAQIIQSATHEPGTQQDGPKKDGASLERSARPDARTDTVLPQFENVSQSAGSSGSAAPQPTAPPARTESIVEPPAAPPTSSHDIRVRVPDNNGGSTQVRFVESGGEVRVSVRTADEGLAQNLRTHLNDLTQRLSDGGMPAEMWKPAPNAASSQNDSQQQSQQEGRGSGGQGSGGQNGQQDRQQKRPAWLDEMEVSLHGEQN